MKTSTGWLLAAVGIAVAAAPAVAGAPSFVPDRTAPFVVAAWLPTWDDAGAASLSDALRVGGVSEVSPTWAGVRADGTLALTPPASSVLLQTSMDGARLIPVVQNYADDAWQGDLMASILSDPQRAAVHRRALVQAARENHWDGVDIDYEGLPPTIGPQFIAYLTALRDDLHAAHRLLSVAVPARAGDDDPGTLAYSYQALGRVADEVRVMAYDHAWSASAPGPIAPTAWVRAVVRYAVARVPREKLMLGLATYGYDWSGTTGRDVGAADAEALARREHADLVWGDAAAAVTFRYRAHGRQHVVWFEDARSMAVKQQIAVDAGLRGVAIWRLGGEDPAVWTTVARATVGSAR